jgi:hypothetical protein
LFGQAYFAKKQKNFAYQDRQGKKRDKNSFMIKKTHKRGPKEDLLKLDGNWENAVKKAIFKEKPKKSWPKKATKPRKFN